MMYESECKAVDKKKEQNMNVVEIRVLRWKSNVCIMYVEGKRENERRKIRWTGCNTE